jgi:hypothetical protein
MRTPLAFIREHLDPVDRLDEVLFGLIMAIGFTGAFRLGLDETDSRTLFVEILGCNLAWGIVDGSMYAMSRLHDRGRRERLHRSVVKAPTEEDALRRIAKELDDRLVPLTTEAERRQIYERVLTLLKRSRHERARLHRSDVLGGLAVALAIVLSTLPVVLPFLVITNPDIAVHVANAVATAMLFGLGWWWGRAVGASPWGVGLALTLFAVVMVGVTLLLGG